MKKRVRVFQTHFVSILYLFGNINLLHLCTLADLQLEILNLLFQGIDPPVLLSSSMVEALGCKSQT